MSLSGPRRSSRVQAAPEQGGGVPRPAVVFGEARKAVRRRSALGAGVGATPPRAASAGVFGQVTIGGLAVGREVLGVTQTCWRGDGREKRERDFFCVFREGSLCAFRYLLMRQLMRLVSNGQMRRSQAVEASLTSLSPPFSLSPRILKPPSFTVLSFSFSLPVDA